MIGELMDRQEAARVKLYDILHQEDKSFQVGLLATVDEDRLIAVTLSMTEMLSEDEEASEEHLLMGMEFLDNLDTLNFQVVSKNTETPKKKKHGRSRKR